MPSGGSVSVQDRKSGLKLLKTSQKCKRSVSDSLSPSLTNKQYSAIYKHTVCTCWRRGVRTGSKHMPSERSSQTAGPAKREKKPNQHYSSTQVCTNRKQRYICMMGGSVDWQYESSLPHLPEAPHTAHHRSGTASGWLWPALDGTYTHIHYTYSYFMSCNYVLA